MDVEIRYPTLVKFYADPGYSKDMYDIMRSYFSTLTVDGRPIVVYDHGIFKRSVLPSDHVWDICFTGIDSDTYVLTLHLSSTGDFSNLIDLVRFDWRSNTYYSYNCTGVDVGTDFITLRCRGSPNDSSTPRYRRVRIRFNEVVDIDTAVSVLGDPRFTISGRPVFFSRNMITTDTETTFQCIAYTDTTENNSIVVQVPRTTSGGIGVTYGTFFTLPGWDMLSGTDVDGPMTWFARFREVQTPVTNSTGGDDLRTPFDLASVVVEMRSLTRQMSECLGRLPEISPDNLRYLEEASKPWKDIMMALFPSTNNSS